MSDVKVSENRQKKEVIVASLQEKVTKAQGMVFTNYQGLTHQQIEALKKALKPVDAEYVNTKNTLLLRALSEKIDTEKEKGQFKNPTATMFMYSDIVEPLKQLTKTIKELKLPMIKFGILEGALVSDKDVITISKLPPLDILRAQALGQMKAPIAGLHRALNWNLQTLVMTLNAIKEKKS